MWSHSGRARTSDGSPVGKSHLSPRSLTRMSNSGLGCVSLTSSPHAPPSPFRTKDTNSQLPTQPSLSHSVLTPVLPLAHFLPVKPNNGTFVDLICYMVLEVQINRSLCFAHTGDKASALVCQFQALTYAPSFCIASNQERTPYTSLLLYLPLYPC